MADSSNETPKKTGKGEMSMETRLLIAFLLMGVVLFVTPYVYKQPPQPKAAPVKAPAPPAEAVEQAAAPPPAVEAKPLPGQVAAAKEETHVVETDVFRVVFSNRGAAVRSWILKKYPDQAGKPLDLVNQPGAAKAGFPFSLVFPKQKPAANLSDALYAARLDPDGAGIGFQFSNGSVFSEKSFRFARGTYLVKVASEVRQAGAGSVPHFLAWRGGFGDPSVEAAYKALHTLYWDTSENKLVVNEAKVAADGPVTRGANYAFAGIEDAYFAAVFLGNGSSNFEIQTYSDGVKPPAADKEEPHAGFAAGGSGENRFSVFVGPKDLDILRKVDPKLEQVVDFGWFSILARPLFLALNWVNDKLVRNYGWSIVVVTVIINFLLLPLKISSLRSAKKMQVLQPQIAAINEKYKHLSLRDPRKAEQNQELMDLYKRNGVNPLGGCVPVLLQIPFFFAFYKVLSVAIEMRGADWLWVTDLSRPETIPIRILPVAMIVTQFILQKMTPNPSADPSQQRIMMLMPLMFGFMFYGVQSGLVLYWLTGNVVGIAQQWFFNRTAHVSVRESKPAVPKKKSSRK
jgi:YidC/Oxa1 family membrane protein insertase